jgi:hypothetical protein
VTIVSVSYSPRLMSAKSDVKSAKVADKVATTTLSAAGALKSKLRVTVAFTGAAVMVVEIVGTRLIGPSFGVSLFVWSALIAVTLSSLAVGYYVGGSVVDRRPAPKLLGYVIGAFSILKRSASAESSRGSTPYVVSQISYRVIPLCL